MTVPQAFDSLIAKLIVTGANRGECLERSRRALAEFEIGGMPTVLPFHRAVVDDPAFTGDPFTVHTGWIETEFRNDLPPYSGEVASANGSGAAGAGADHGRGRRQAARGGAARPDLARAGAAGAQAAQRPRRRAGAVGGRGGGGGGRRAATRWSARCRARS